MTKQSIFSYITSTTELKKYQELTNNRAKAQLSKRYVFLPKSLADKLPADNLYAQFTSALYGNMVLPIKKANIAVNKQTITDASNAQLADKLIKEAPERVAYEFDFLSQQKLINTN